VISTPRIAFKNKNQTPALGYLVDNNECRGRPPCLPRAGTEPRPYR